MRDASETVFLMLAPFLKLAAPIGQPPFFIYQALFAAVSPVVLFGCGVIRK